MPALSVRRSLIVRVVLALTAVGIIPLLILAGSLVDANRTAMQTQVRRTHTVAATTAAERIETFVDSRQTLTRTVALHPELSVDPRSDGSRQFLADLLASDPALGLIDVVTPAGESVIRVQRRGESALFAAALAGTRIGKPALWRSAGRLFVLTSEPLDEGRGFVRTISDGAPVLGALRALGLQDEADMALLDSSATLLLGAGNASDFPPTMITAARSSRLNGSGMFRDAAGEQVVGAYAPVPSAGWVVISRQPAAIAEELVSALRVRSLAAVAAALLLAAILSYAAYRGIVRPIREILAAQRQITGGARTTASGGEIDQLRDNVQLLQRRITDQEELGRTFLGRYQIVTILGQGGMGTVFRAWDPKLERSVALKTIHFGDAATAGSSNLLSSLMREAVLIAKLSHPNIVAVYDIEDSPEAAFFAMEFVEGVTLARLLRVRGALEPGEALLIALAIARALEAAHARGILHHDIKPANVLLGRDHTIKVTDFGISDVLTSVAKKRDEIFGTPGYLPPEGTTGQPQDQRSDLFSLGVVLYECLSGEQPFARSSMRPTLVATLRDPHPPLQLPVEWKLLEATVDHLLAKRPKDRPSSAAEIAEVLGGMAQQHGVTWSLQMPSPGWEIESTAPTASWIPTIPSKESAA